MADYASCSLDELIEIVTTWPVGMPVRAIEQILARGETAIPVLSASLDRWRGEERRDLLWAVVLLGEMKSPGAIPVLIDQVQRTGLEEEELSRAACESLAKIGAASIPALREVANSPDQLCRTYAYAALGWIPDEQAFSLLLAALRHDPESGDAVACALGERGNAQAVPHLYEAYQACAPWQRIEFESAIRDLHFGRADPPVWKEDWRARYRRDPVTGTFGLGWLGVSVLVRRHIETMHQRVVPPLKSLEEILHERDEVEDSSEMCADCGAPIELPTGVPVCPESALWIALYQARFLSEAREAGLEDFYDLFDDLDEMLWDHYDSKKTLPASQEKQWNDDRDELTLKWQTCRWLVEQNIASIGAGRALLLAKALQLADRFGDPEGFLSPVNRTQRSAPKTGRNDRCPCGSGLKYKRCCLRNS